MTDPEHTRLLSAADAARERLHRVREHQRSPGVYACDEWCTLCAEGDLAWFLFRRDGE